MDPVAVEAASTGKTDGRSTRWDDHRAERRRELARSARRAVHHQGPDVSMDEIAAEIGTSKSIVYRYFVDKAGLQVAVGELVLEAVRDAVTTAARTADGDRERLRAMVAAYLAMIESSPHVYAFVTDTSSGPAFSARAADVVADPLGDLLAGPGVNAASAQAWARGVVGFVHGVGQWWMTARRGSSPTDRERLADQVGGWLWSGVTGAGPGEGRLER